MRRSVPGSGVRWLQQRGDKERGSRRILKVEEGRLADVLDVGTRESKDLSSSLIQSVVG